MCASNCQQDKVECSHGTNPYAGHVLPSSPAFTSFKANTTRMGQVSKSGYHAEAKIESPPSFGIGLFLTVVILIDHGSGSVSLPGCKDKFTMRFAIGVSG